MALSPGTRLGPYEILSALGVGGMGEVYRARDTKLNRDVALKVIPDTFALDPDRVSRFKREAQVLASLNHAHIAAIYGFEDSGETHALVLELVEGETMADRIARGPIPIDEALPIARQICAALEAAHEQGIIHRDLKPANIKVRSDGTVKVLDFGLAKAMAPSLSRPDLSHSPTITSPPMTAAGIILGTAAYMCPEQALGSTIVDKRTDLWSFGAVLYEMLTGTRLFDAPTISQTIAAVLTKEPDWTALPADTPASIRRLLRRCLEKDRTRRLDSAAAARLEIDDALTAAEGSPARSSRGVPMAIASALGAALLAALAMWGLRRPAPPSSSPLTRFTITPPPTLPLTLQGTDRDFALSPDGSFLVYRAGSQGQLVVRRLDRLEASPLSGVSNARQPFVSPDGRWIGFIENNTTLKKVASSGGPAITLARLPGSPRGASWVDDTTLVVATNTTGLLRVPAAGGEPTVLTTPDRAHGELGHYYPSALPGGRAVLFTIRAAEPDNAQIAVLDLQTGQHTTLMRGGSDAHYVASGHLAYAAGGALSVVRFDLGRRAVVGAPVPIVEQVSVAGSGALNAEVTRAGTLVYVPGGSGAVTPQSLLWVDRQGNETPIPAPPRAYVSPRLSPDGTQVALAISYQDVWMWDLSRQTLTRLTFNGGGDIAPVWTPDGRRVVFASSGSGALNLFARAADGTGTDARLTTSANIQLPTSVTPDGAAVVGIERRPLTGSDVVRVALDAGAGQRGAEAPAVHALVETRFTEQNGEVSPDGRFLAYESNESGRFEIYVRPYPQVATGRWLLSTGGGTRPAWTRGGLELVYLDGANLLTAVPVETIGSTFRSGTPATLSTTAYATTVAWRTYDVSRDGRFLVLKDAAGTESTPPSLVVVQQWFDELNRLVPAK